MGASVTTTATFECTRGYRQELLERLRAGFAQVPDFSERSSPSSRNTPLPIQEAALLKRSVDGAANRIELAQKSGFISSLHFDRGPKIDLAAVRSSVFVLQGQDHGALGEECQDAAIIDRNEDRILAACADGVGSVPFSDIGSSMMARAFVRHADLFLRAHHGSILDPYLLGRIHAALYLEQHAWTLAAGLSPIEAYNLFLATTLQFAIITPGETLIAGLGDGSVTLQGKTFPVLERSLRQESLRGSRVPPLLAAAYCHETAIPELWKYLSTCVATRTTGDIGPSSEELEAEHIIAQFMEAGAFYVYGYGSTPELLSGGIELTTDGVAYADWNDTLAGSRFPLRALLSVTESEVATELAHLHNLATLDHSYSMDRLNQLLSRFMDALLFPSKNLLQARFYETCREFLKTDPEVVQSLRSLNIRNLSEVFNEARVIRPEFEYAAAAIPTFLLAFAKRLLSKELEARGLSVNQAPPLRDDISVVRCGLEPNGPHSKSKCVGSRGIGPLHPS